MANKLSNDQIGWLIGRSFLLLIAALFLIFGVFVNHDCDIDKQYLSCRLTGSFFDWFGSIAFLGGLVWMSGLVKGSRGLYSPAGSVSGNMIVFVIMILAVVLFWNL